MNWKPGSWWEAFSSALLTEDGSLGVYLEKSSLTLVQVQKGFSGIQVMHLERLLREQDGLASLEPQIQEIIASWDLADCPVNLAVSRDQCFFREVQLPLAAAENLAQVVSYEVDRFLPLPTQNLYYDYQVLKETQTGIHLMLLALPREPVEQCLELLTRAGLKPYSLEPGPVAAANAFTLAGGKLPASWLLLQEAQGVLELTHIQGRTLGFSRPLRPKSGQRLGEALLAEIRHLEKAGNPPQAVGLYGQIAPAPEITALARQENLAVITPDNDSIPGLPREKELERAALAAMGAALRGLGKVAVGTNLLPPEERAAVTSSGFSLNKVLLLVFLALAFLYPTSLLVHKRLQLYRVDRELAQITPQFRQVEKQINQVRGLAKQMQNLRRLEKSPNKLNVLKDLTQLIPKHTWLFNLRISQQNLEMGGMSKSAADLIPLLEKSGWLTKTEFASPIVTDANKLEHFKIKAEIKGLELGP